MDLAGIRIIHIRTKQDPSVCCIKIGAKSFHPLSEFQPSPPKKQSSASSSRKSCPPPKPSAIDTGWEVPQGKEQNWRYALTSINTCINAPRYPKHIPQSTDRVRALHALTVQLATTVTAAPPDHIKTSLFQEPNTWLPVPFQTRHASWADQVPHRGVDADKRPCFEMVGGLLANSTNSNGTNMDDPYVVIKHAAFSAKAQYSCFKQPAQLTMGQGLHSLLGIILHN